MDFTGKGYITLPDFLSSNFVLQLQRARPGFQKPLQLSLEEIKEFLDREKIFDSQGHITILKFGSVFFPHQSLTEQKFSIVQNNEDVPQQKRLQELDSQLKAKFQKNWQLVRKAFLSCDPNCDGAIDLQEFTKMLQSEKTLFSLEDLSQLINHHSSSKDSKITYRDFCKWIGTSIHMNEGFYFRHDSQINLVQKTYADSRRKELVDSNFLEQVKYYLPQDQLEELVWTKIGQKWKSLREAYHNMQGGGESNITRERLRQCFLNWAIEMSEEQFEPIFQQMDIDQDGSINFLDFLNSVGKKCFHKEGLYFRQDKKYLQFTRLKCQMYGCCSGLQKKSQYCGLHTQILIQKANEILKNINIQDLKGFQQHLGLSESQFFVDFEKLKEILKKFHVHLTQDQLQILEVKAIDGIIQIQTLLKKIQAQVIQLQNEPTVDKAGYLGTMNRVQTINQPFTWNELAATFQNSNSLKKIQKVVKSIDKDKNGFVTCQELDDIVKMVCPELQNKELLPFFQKFSDYINPVLVSYRQFYDALEKDITDKRLDLQIIEQLSLDDHLNSQIPPPLNYESLEKLPSVFRANKRSTATSLVSQSLEMRSRSSNLLKNNLSVASAMAPSEVLLQCVAEKLKPQWKQIYRLMFSLGDFDAGQVRKQTFSSAARDCGVYLTNQDLQYLESAFKVGSGEMDCKKMGRQLGLDSSITNSILLQKLRYKDIIKSLGNLYQTERSQYSCLSKTDFMDISQQKQILKKANAKSYKTNTLQVSLRALKIAFVALDTEQTGFISFQQSQNVLKRFGLRRELADTYQSSKGVAYKKLLAAMK